ncbi:Lin1244/Lin1753 domain-containing protein [Escherichia coli]|uniref:Lin1244/Lin1753 domain-containing protein n=1 Tax=Escherichia coli TaxID=562 RepID=UPI000BE55E61|nr:Lin1244/Lin1753 domain-containing protein [Escherichia coli]
MKWFKHDSDANRDEKLQNVLLDYGLEGYGLYWYCIELIAYEVDQHNLTFELKHDARIIARNVGSSPKRVEEMMRYFIEVGLFDCSHGVVRCLSLAKRLDQSMASSKSEFREAIKRLNVKKNKKLDNPLVEVNNSPDTEKEKPWHNHDAAMAQPCHSHGLEVEEEKETEEEKKNIKRKEVNQDGDFQISDAALRCLDFYNEKAGCKCRDAKPFLELLTETKTRKAYTEDEITLVIEWALTQWRSRGGTPKPINICRVTKFDGYLADAEQWRKLSATANAADVVEVFNSTFDGMLPPAELDRDLERKIYAFTDYLKDKSINGFVAYFETFKNTASDFYFGNGFTATLDFLLKPKTLRDTRAGVL